MSAQLSRCVAVYSRHFVASRINARPRRRRRRRVYFGPYRNNPDNNGMDRIVTLPVERRVLGSDDGGGGGAVELVKLTAD